TTTRIEYLFFFQAEDGIRDGHVTGVQTCALPISDPVDPGLQAPRVRLLHPQGAHSVRTRVSDVPRPDRAHARGRRRYRAVARPQIGRASCRERVEISVGAVSVKKKRE